MKLSKAKSNKGYITEIANKVNELVNIPFIKEGTEQEFFESVIRAFFEVVEHFLTEGGDIPDNMDEWLDLIAKKVNDIVNIPYVPEKIEKWIIRKLVQTIYEVIEKLIKNNFK